MSDVIAREDPAQQTNETYRSWHSAAQFLLGCIGLASVTFVCYRLRLNSATVVLLYLTVVVLVSLRGRFASSACLSILAVLCLQYFFLPPLFSFRVTDPLDIMAVIAFLITALVITRLMSKARRSEAYLVQAQRLTRVGNWAWDPSESHNYYSPEVFNIFGLDPAKGTPTLADFVGIYHPEDRAFVEEAEEQLVSENKAYDIKYRIVRPDGELRWIREVGTPVYEQEVVTRYIGACLDVTEQEHMTQELRKSEEKFRKLVDIIPAAVYTCDLSGRLTYYNRRAVELWRREPILEGTERFCGSFRLYDLDGVLIPHDQSLMAEAIRTGQRPQENKEVIIERSDQSRITVMVNIAPMKNEKGEVIGAINCFQDITERKQAEATLEQAFQEIQVLKDQLYKENLALKEEIDRSSMFEEIVGASPPLQAVLARAAKVAPTDSTVLITGETGTGKELIARAIHKRSQRSARAFVSVNCAAVPPSLIASELFGHEKGAFTGALQRHLGRFELAEGGTIFLDEIGELPAETQIALLHVLQERDFQRVGGDHSIPTDVRVIAATNRDLNAAIVAGAFRSDLFYRLNVFPIEMPPLRDRKEDISVLVEYFIDRYASKAGKKIRNIDKKTLDLLQSYPWPGNIRELQNVIERSVIVCDTETFSVDESWLSRESLTSQPVSQPLSEDLAKREKAMIEAALAATRGRVSGPSGAAAKLGIPPSTLESKIRSLKINKHHFKAA